eukprot:SAG31_NODE_1331_length_8748_cov_5.583189_6_plen_145_part_00
MKAYSSLGVVPQQLVITLPWFGVKWQCRELSGVNCTYAGQNACPGHCRPVNNAGYAELLMVERHNHTIQYQPSLTPSPFIDLIENGTRLRWEYDDPRSIYAKAMAISAAAVRGMGAWTADALDYSNRNGSDAMWHALLCGLRRS